MTTFDPEIPLLGINPRDKKKYSRNNICTYVFIAALFTIAKIWENPEFPEQMTGKRNFGTSTQWNTMQLSEKMKS